ncbi:MAG: glycosyltransferase [Rhodospirillaceae bacterium]|nr:glycosyltransferase [Rhodospirillaceae bacterium]MBT3627497.1 glycosyltransferase [Rhodospirillaceae bacterium]MBT3927335.1 glycosyltransferase [Rhodospirillaceae bacterium]MBT5037779.1 glycosyltransferase [Rhodospirillaceae bacterium]MBT5677643.1 glycosyltransferase [Rhodospirillaceae bacterium]
MQKHKKILMPVYNEIDYDGRVLRAAECLGEKHSVTVFSVNSHNGYSNPNFSLRTVSLAWFGSRGMLRWAYYSLMLLIAALRVRPDIIHAHDYFTAYPGRIAAALCGAALVYDAHELIIPEKGQQLGRRNGFFYRLEKRILPRAALIIAANPERAELMREHYGLAQAPLDINNITPAPVGTPGPDEALRRYPALQRGRDGLVRLVFQGFISADRGVVASIAALAQLPEHFELVLVGGGPPADIAAMHAAVAEYGVERRVIYLGRVPRDHLHDILQCCDIGIVYYFSRTLNQLYCAPNKIYEYAQAGLPMISSCQPPLRPVHEKYGISELVGCGGDEAERLIPDLAKASQTIAADLAGYRKMIPAFLAENQWEREAQRLREAVDGL